MKYHFGATQTQTLLIAILPLANLIMISSASSGMAAYVGWSRNLESQATRQDELNQWIQQLQTGTTEEQREAVQRIADFGSEAEPAIDLLLERLESDNLDLSTLSALAIGAIGPAAGDAAKPIFQQLEKLENKKAYREALNRYGQALGMLQEPAIPILIEGLNSDDTYTIWTCAEALHSMGPIAKPALPRTTELLSDDQFEMAWTGAYLVEGIGPAASAAVPTLIKMLDSDNLQTQVIALRALTSIGRGAKDAGLRVSELVEEGNMSVRSWAALTLGSIGPVEGIDTARVLREKTTSGYDSMRERALLGLAAFGTDAGMDTAVILRELTDDANYTNRPYAAFAYAKVSEDYDHALEVLLTLGEADGSTLESIPLLAKLGKDATPAVPRLAKLLSSTDSDICYEVITALTEMGIHAKAALPEISKITDHEDAEIASLARRLERVLRSE